MSLTPADRKAKGESTYSLKSEEEEEKVSSFAHDLVKAKPVQDIEDEGIDEDQELIGGGVSFMKLTNLDICDYHDHSVLGEIVFIHTHYKRMFLIEYQNMTTLQVHASLSRPNQVLSCNQYWTFIL